MFAAPDISEVYSHYRGEYLPDGTFFEHALADKFKIPGDKIAEFTEIFLTSLQSAKLVERKDEKYRILDINLSSPPDGDSGPAKRLTVSANVNADDSCFVVNVIRAADWVVLSNNI